MEDDAIHGHSRSIDADATAGSGWVSTEVAARALRVSPRTIRRYIKRGELAAKPQGEGVNRAWLVSVESLHALRAARPPEIPEDARSNVERKAVLRAADGGAMGEALREMAARIEARTAEAVELRTHLELSARAQSTVEERLAEERTLRQEAERERDDLRRRLQERPSWWGIVLVCGVGTVAAVALLLIYLVLVQ